MIPPVPDSRLSLVVTGRVVQGHRVASGGNGDPNFPGGSLAMQVPHFRKRGLDLSGFFLATLNLSLAPRIVALDRGRADHTFRQVAWHPSEPAEDFSFFRIAIRKTGQEDWIDGWIYHPHPDTKPAHFQPPNLLEVIARIRITGIDYGDEAELAFDPGQLSIGEK